MAGDGTLDFYVVVGTCSLLQTVQKLITGKLGIW